MQRFFPEEEAGWYQPQKLPNSSFVCGYCGRTVSSIQGYKLGRYPDGSGAQIGALYLCPNCGGAVFSAPDGRKHPSPAFGNSVPHVPESLNELYEEARRCTSQTCFTAAVLLCRKMLMNIAVDQKADEGKSFLDYVDFLSDKGYVPPNGKHWVDHIRKKGNEATHQIAVMSESDAKDLLSFVEMLLRFIFEFPNRVPLPPTKK